MGGHDPKNGRGKEDDIDHGNHTGSYLMLAMLDPDKYGITGGRPLANFFGQNRWVMEYPSDAPARSGRGPDNQGTNFIEALLNDWHNLPEKQEIRDWLNKYLEICTSSICLPLAPGPFLQPKDDFGH